MQHLGKAELALREWDFFQGMLSEKSGLS